MGRAGKILHRLRDYFSGGEERTALLFATEGAIFTLVTNLANNNNNLFATRLGATDFQLSLLSLMPQLLGVAILIPGAIFTDRLENKKKMVILALLAVCASFVLAGFSPLAGSARLWMFLICISLSAGSIALYNSSWQAFFADTVPPRRQNATYSVRTQLTFVIGIVVPLITGSLLTAQPGNEQKILLHQVFLWLAAGCALCQILILRRVQGGTVKEPSGATVADFLHAARDLGHNRRFLGFAVVALFFYMTWHLDWTMYYIGQTKYVGLSELWLSISNVGSALAQFLTIRFWARMNERRGVCFGMILGAVGLMLAPLSIIVPLALPAEIRPITHVILRSLFDLTCANVTLNILQNLLRVIGEKNRTLSIAVYTIFITLSNAFLPMVGVAIYTALGANEAACAQFYWIALVLRVFAVVFWTLRWRHEERISSL